jgi:multicomponent Na+:H+ antiporter subunit G
VAPSPSALRPATAAPAGLPGRAGVVDLTGVGAAEALAAALLAGSVFFTAVAALGLVRLPDVYARAHATSKSDTLGTALALAAVGLAFGPSAAGGKVAFLLLFVLVTNPTASHAVARAADAQGLAAWTRADDGGPEASGPAGGAGAAPDEGGAAAPDGGDECGGGDPP